MFDARRLYRLGCLLNRFDQLRMRRAVRLVRSGSRRPGPHRGVTIVTEPRLFNVSDVDPWMEDDPPRLGPTPGCEPCSRWGHDSTCPGCSAVSAGHYAYLLLHRIEQDDEFDQHAWPWMLAALRGALDELRDDEFTVDGVRRRIIAELEGACG